MGKTPTVLMVLDGFGLTDEIEGNAIRMSKMPNLDKIMSTYPWAEGKASGLSVGLPDGQMGNSEVGHTNIGAGRIVYQELTRITKSIQDGDFFSKPALMNAVKNCKENDKALHLFGLLSDGGVHSHIEHLYGLLKLAKENNLTKVYVHAFMDGRDTAPSSGKRFISQLEDKIKEIGVGKIATISGRFYAMDRDKRWERVEKAYLALVSGEGEKAESATACIEESYKKDILDEFIVPTVIQENGKPVAIIEENDSVVFFNFRPDRARELTTAFCSPEFDGFGRVKGYYPLKYVCFTEYDENTPNKEVVFTSENLNNTLGEYLSNAGLTQVRMAETEKYPHVTFFFNGGKEEAYKGEDRVLIPSPKVLTYDLQPEMSASEVTHKLIESLESEKYDFILVNYANPDMVGHTGMIDATVKALEVIDDCLGTVLEAVLKADAQMLICADHGNCDKLIDYVTKEAFTSHTTNPVPFIIINSKKEIKGVKKDGKLCDIAPTILDMMNLDTPEEMTGKSLLDK